MQVSVCPLDWTDCCFEEVKNNSRFFFPKKTFFSSFGKVSSSTFARNFPLLERVSHFPNLLQIKSPISGEVFPLLLGGLQPSLQGRAAGGEAAIFPGGGKQGICQKKYIINIIGLLAVPDRFGLLRVPRGAGGRLSGGGGHRGRVRHNQCHQETKGITKVFGFFGGEGELIIAPFFIIGIFFDDIPHFGFFYQLSL